MKIFFGFCCYIKINFYLCKVNKTQNAKQNTMKSTIKTTDFSNSTLELFNIAKETKSFVRALDFARLLIENDFPVNDVKEFMRVNFKNDYKYLDYSI